jgi:hypothetical protein
MPDPADLPPELFEQILATTLRDRACNNAEHSHGFNVGTDIRQSSQLMTVSRAWYDIIGARLYSQWSYNGARSSASTCGALSGRFCPARVSLKACGGLMWGTGGIIRTF